MKQKPNIKIENKKRILLFLLLIFLFTTGVQIQRQSSVLQVWENYLVKEGDTLWSITVQQNLENIDYRDTIAKIKEFNELETSELYPGQEILIPIGN
ncbi:MAG: LysM peptidoglycan-binding domain-containing protein [Tissierellia bacterium]|nr:LysM peptidoglycan-binding domain-containing protein [Tissierellia bacterium]